MKDIVMEEASWRWAMSEKWGLSAQESGECNLCLGTCACKCSGGVAKEQGNKNQQAVVAAETGIVLADLSLTATLFYRGPWRVCVCL